MRPLFLAKEDQRTSDLPGIQVESMSPDSEQDRRLQGRKFSTSSHASQKSGAVAKPRAILTQDQAVEIFMLKPPASDPKSSKHSHRVARRYDVSEKTVRDIWRGRTWHAETKHLDPCRPARISAPPGRPLGKKDRAPRRISHSTEASGAKEANILALEDPFHDDWPYWARAERYSAVTLPPVIVFTPLSRTTPAKFGERSIL